MPRFTTLCLVVLAAFGLTFTLDVAQRKITHPGTQSIVFVSMWAVGEPMQQAYEAIFRQFEKRSRPCACTRSICSRGSGSASS